MQNINEFAAVAVIERVPDVVTVRLALGENLRQARFLRSLLRLAEHKTSVLPAATPNVQGGVPQCR